MRRGMRSRTPEGTSLSARITSALRMALCVALVNRSGWPGPLPASIMRPLFSTWSRCAVSRGVDVLGFAAYDFRTESTSVSVMFARRRRGQYSQIWESQRMRLLFAASRSASVTRALKALVWSVESSSRVSARERCERWSSSWIRLRIVPSREHAAPRFGGREDAISRRIREESLQPRPLVVTPIWRGPSVCVLRRLNVQSEGESATLTGMRFRWQSLDICEPIPSVVSSCETCN